MITVTLEESIKPAEILEGRATRLERALAWQILKDTAEFLPALTGSFTIRSHVIGNRVVYPGPYARYLWHGVAMVNSKTGKGPMYIPEVGYRWPRGAILKPTTRPLKFNTAMHAKAQSHWMDASRAQNMGKWKRMGAKIYANGK
jgi:hypothetical protein